jgi:spermidine synthase
MASHRNAFDVIFTDSSDPIGPAVALFERPYYQMMYDSLRQGGVICCQGESIWLDLDLIASIATFAGSIFPVLKYAYASVPTYTSGTIGFIIAAKDATTILTRPNKDISFLENECNFYNEALHRAAFSLPTFVKRKIMEERS